MNYGNLLKNIRQKKKMKQSELAERLLCCQSHVSLLEQNKVNPSKTMAKLIKDYAKRLRIDIKQFE